MSTLDLTSPVQLKDLLYKHGLRPRKRFGQNFLVDRNVLNKVLDALDIKEGDPVLEIGPGVGTLTLGLAERGARVVAVELDRDMIAVLGETLSGTSNVEVVSGDFLRFDLPSFITEHFGDARIKICGNLPYNITSPIITKIFTAHQEQVERVVMMIQKEVAERLEAVPGTRAYGSLSVFVQYHSDPEIIGFVSGNSFLPPPDVTSAIVRLNSKASPFKVQNETLFFDVVHCALSKRRKTLQNSLTDCPPLFLPKEKVAEALKNADIDPFRRAETLSIEEFSRIADSL